MRKAALFVGVLALALSNSAAWAVEHSHHHGDGMTSCSQQHNNFDDMETFYSQEQFSVPMGSGVMQVTAAHNGGVSLIRGDGNAYEVTVCKSVGAENQGDADKVFSQITADHSGSQISVRGPQDGERWTATLIIKVPQGANMKVSSHNGPVAAREVSGTFDLETVNGPISVKKISGKITAKAQNGPIAFEGESGDYDLQTQNGPISIELENQSWQNGKLDAHANNGPISLRLPKGYQSGVVVSSDGHSPMSCSADVCSEARKTWDDGEKRIEFGPSNAVIKISTHNGPVSVGTRTLEAEM